MLTRLRSLLNVLREESTPKFIQVVGQIQFLMVVGLKSLFPCCLLAKGWSLFLGTACISSHAFHVAPIRTFKCIDSLGATDEDKTNGSPRRT